MKREEDKEPKSARDLLSGDALERMFNEGRDKRAEELAEEAQRIANRSSADPAAGSRYDFDLAEFPLFYFYKNTPLSVRRQPLTYEDSIRGKDGEKVARKWTVYPGHHGFGGPSTQDMLFDLLQIYVEQGACGQMLHFGTLHALHARRYSRRPTKKDYARMMRDIDILRGYDFHAENAFWDRATGAYVSMRWNLFGTVLYPTARPSTMQSELPFGCIEVSQILREIAKNRGFFCTGFPQELWYSLTPIAKRLTLYLSKRFMFEKVHRRSVDAICEAIPIRSSTQKERNRQVRLAARDIIAHEIPILEDFKLENTHNGWMVQFRRKKRPDQRPNYKPRSGVLRPGLENSLESIIEAVGGEDNRSWWTTVVNTIGQNGVDRALGELKMQMNDRHTSVRKPAALLSKICKDIGEQAGSPIPRSQRRRPS